MASELESLVTRLERVTSRLEQLVHVPEDGEEVDELLERPTSPLPQCSSPRSASSSASTASTAAIACNSPLLPQQLLCSTVSCAMPVVSSVSELQPICTNVRHIVAFYQDLARMGSQSLTQFDDILAGPFTTYMRTSAQIGGDVSTHASLVDQAFK
ncbi:hypothetical protein B566_EDAN004562 [Ephemera danica]|nr:hypothetical protein B566_EDAN004562 [Ephemera danica]